MLSTDIYKILAFPNQIKKQQIFRQIYRLLFIGIILAVNANSTFAQNKDEKILIDRDTISTPITFKGVSGGSLTATEITKTENTATGYCDGFVTRSPNHILKLESFFDFLKVEVRSSADTTILIKGPGGIWCNDDSENTNPAIEGQWQPGVYQVWIGSYQADSNKNYRIQITGKESR